MKKEIQRTVDELLLGNVILYPTDTVWGIGCDAENTKAVKRIFEIKERPESKTFILLVSGLDMLQRYVKGIPAQLATEIQNQSRPTTYILPNAQNLPAELIAEDGSVAFRIVNDEFCHQVLLQFRRPLVSTSANLSGQQTTGSFSGIPEAIKSNVDYIVNHRQQEEITAKPSRIVAFEPGGGLKIIRD